MRVLWFAMTSSCYDVKNTGSWIEALEKIFRQYLPDVELGIAFEHHDDVLKVEREGVTYYPIHVKRLTSPKEKYHFLRPYYLRAIHDFSPDIVHCFGTERWHYGLLTKEINIPVVIHIMGNMNAISIADEIVMHKAELYSFFRYNPIKIWLYSKSLKICRENQMLEREVFKVNNYYMGRTEWDKNIVKFYSNKSHYYHCEEAIRENIYNTKLRWNFHSQKRKKLLSIGNISSLKGPDMILRTAYLLKYHFHFDFEWRISCDKEMLSLFEYVTNVKCDNVNVVPIGRLNSEEIIMELVNTDFYIHSSIIDNSPNTICEAQLIGTPVISTNAGGIPSLIKDGETGFLYPYSEPHALAFQIMNLAGCREVLEYVSQNEIECAHTRHFPKEIACRVKKIYQEVIDDYKQNK